MLDNTGNNLAHSLVEALNRWENRRFAQRQQGDSGTHTGMSIAISRQSGALGNTIARGLGERLGWDVYNHELLERIAQDMHVRVSLVESVDERHVSWLQECLEAFTAAQTVNQATYFHHLLETVLSLGAHGDCIIVGRGAPHILPPQRTLRVRLVAPLDDRITTICRTQQVSRQQAATHIAYTDRQRHLFVSDHLHLDPTNPERYDLVLNTSRFPVGTTVDAIIEALHRMQDRAMRERDVVSARA